MELHQLEYVLAVAKNHNFTRAAEEIKISQSSLSQQICKLESELGISLFARTTRSVQLTPAGEEFVTHANRIISEIVKARRCIHEYVSIEKGTLTLGVIEILGYSYLPHMLVDFQKNHPKIKMLLTEKRSEELLQLLHSSKIDAAICQLNNPNPNIEFYPWMADKMVLVTSHLHPLAKRKSIDLKELQNEKFIMTPPTSRHYKKFHISCMAAGFEPNIIMDCSITKNIMGFVREGLGITVLSSHIVEMEQDPSLRIISLTPTINTKTGLAIRNNEDLPPTLKVFLRFATQWLNKIDRPELLRSPVTNPSFAGQKFKKAL